MAKKIYKKILNRVQSYIVLAFNEVLIRGFSRIKAIQLNNRKSLYLILFYSYKIFSSTLPIGFYSTRKK